MDLFKSHDKLIRRTELTIGLLLSLIIVLFHFIFMQNAGALWRDEVTSVNLAAMPRISDIWRSLRLDSFPILPSLVLRLWMTIGTTSDLWLRVFGLLIGIAIIRLLWFNARAFGYSAPLISLVLFALNPMAIRVGDSIRPYGLGFFLILLSYALLWKVTYAPSPLRVVVATLTAVLSVQCFYQNAFLLAAIIFAGVIVNFRNKKRGKCAVLIGIGIVSALSLLPYYGIVKSAQQWAVLLQVPTGFQQPWHQLSQALATPGRFMPAVWVGLFGAGILLVLYFQFSRPGPDSSPSRRDITLFCASAMLISTALFLIFIRIASPISHPRYYLPLMAVVAVSLDTILRNTNLGSILRIVFVILVGLSTSKSTWHKIHIRQTNVDLIASELEQSVSKDDLILLDPWYHGISFQRYYNGEAPYITLPPIEDLKIHRFDLVKEKMASDNPLQLVLSSVAATLKSGQRVWFVGTPYVPPEGILPEFLPPAPSSPYRWAYGPYHRAWLQQTGFFLKAHSLYISVLPPITEQPVSPYENCSIMFAKGWRQ
jgi:hypothetical protein